MASPARGHNHQVIDLTFLNEEEEMLLCSVLEDDLKLQQSEENRIKYFNMFMYYSFIIITRVL